MTNTPLPPDVLEETILGMVDAEGNPTDNEAKAAQIIVQHLMADGSLETTEVVTQKPPAS